MLTMQHLNAQVPYRSCGKRLLEHVVQHLDWTVQPVDEYDLKLQETNQPEKRNKTTLQLLDSSGREYKR